MKRTMGMPAHRERKTLAVEEIVDILAQSTTDENGRFRFQNVEAPPFRHISVAGKGYYPWDLVAMAPGHGVAWTQLTTANQQSEIILRLPAEGPLRGRLIELGGKPIAGARVKVFGVYPLGDLNASAEDDPAHLDLTWSSIPIVTSSGADGAFTLRGLPREIQTCLVITDPHHERTVLYAATTPPGGSPTSPTIRVSQGRTAIGSIPRTSRSRSNRAIIVSSGVWCSRPARRAGGRRTRELEARRLHSRWRRQLRTRESSCRGYRATPGGALARRGSTRVARHLLGRDHDRRANIQATAWDGA